MTSQDARACPSDLLNAALALAEADDAKGLARMEELVRAYPADPRLQYLRGALLAAAQRYDEAMDAMGRALIVAPDFAIARFQLGLLALSSGDPERACATWAPLQLLPNNDPLRCFADGLEHLARDQFQDAEQRLREGIALNRDNAPLNHDMQLVIDQIGEIMRNAADAPEEEAVSSAQMLLAQSMTRRTMH